MKILVASFLMTTSVCATDWPQFRGPAGSGIAAENTPLPVNIGPESSCLLWKKPLAKGHSSPVVLGESVYVTGFDGTDLKIVSIDRKSGETNWERVAEHENLESIHRIGSRATPTVAADSDVVVSFFGSSGLWCHNTNGEHLWHIRMGPFNNSFGAASSPILVDDKVVMVQDHDTDSFVAAYDKHTGSQIWRAERPDARRNYGSPCIWNVGSKNQVVLTGSAGVWGYDLQSGNVDWTLYGVSRVVSTTPVVGDDNRLYLACTGGSETKQPVFAEVLQTSDSNNNGVLEQNELPKSPIRSFFDQFDRDMDGALDVFEYNSIRQIFGLSRTAAMSIAPDAKGDGRKVNVAWTLTSSIPRNSSPLFHDGVLFLVKDGGILTSVDANNGSVIKRARLPTIGKYYSSPVLGNEKIYVLSERGRLSVIAAKGQWEVLATVDFKEDVYATPAISNGCVFVRTVSNLYCFDGSKTQYPTPFPHQ